MPVRTAPGERRLAPIARAAGFAGVAEYLRDEHVARHRSIAAIARQAEVSRWTVVAALRHRGIAVLAHATKRHDAAERAGRVALALGFESLRAYIEARRSVGMSWDTVAAESGTAATTLRQHWKQEVNIGVS